MAAFKLQGDSYENIPKGENVVKITKVTLKPKRDPKKIVIDVADVQGRTAKSTYNLSTKGGRYYFSQLVIKANGNFAPDDDFELNDTEAVLLNRFVKVDITHDEVPKIVDGEEVEGETTVFANVGKALAGATNFPGRETDLNDLDDLDDGLDELADLDDLDDLDDDDEDDLPI